MNKRIVLILLCLGLALAVAVAGAAAPKKVTITVQMFSGPESDAMTTTAKYWNEKYSAATGITVNAVALSRMGYQEKMQSELVAGLRDPDLVHPFNMQLGTLRPYLQDLRPYLARSDIMKGPDGETYSVDGLLEVALSTVTTADGAVLGLPKDMSELLVYYRKDIIPKPPDTWPEFVELAKKFTKKINAGSPTEYGVVMQGKYEKWTYCSALEALWPAGYEIFKPGDKEIAGENPDSVKAFKIYEDLFKAGALYPGFDNTEYPEVSAALESGNVAMAVQWNANYFSLSNKEMSPKVYDKIALAPPPGWKQADGKVKRSMYVQTINLALNKKSVNKDAAMKFLAWSTFGEGAVLYAKYGGSSPIKKIWLAKDAMMPYPVIAPMVQQYGRCLPMNNNMSELVMIGSSWIQKVGIGNATAEQAAKGMPEEMATFLKNK